MTNVKLPTLEQSLIQTLKDENNRLRDRILNLEQRVKDLMMEKYNAKRQTKNV